MQKLTTKKLMENKQTAVDWLIKIYLQKGKIDSFDIKQAKELEKKQIVDAYSCGKINGIANTIGNETNKPSEQYYKENYEK
jgi:hypothetical protein